MRLPDALSPLRDARFAWYYAGRFISTIGSVVAPIAVVFAVLDISDSATALGVVLAARMIPLIVFLLIGGVIADRMSRSLVVQLSHVLSAVTQGTVGVLLVTGVAEIWMIVVLEALNGTVSAFTFPAMQGIVPQVVPKTHIQQANAMLAFSRNGLAMIGPAIGTLLVVTVGSGWAVLIDAGTWLVAAAFMAKVKLPAAMARDPIEAPSMWGDLRDGWSAFTSLTWVWVVVVAFGFLNAIHAGAWFTLGPFIAKDTIGITAWGWVLGAEATGLLVTTVVMLKWRLRYPVRAGMLGITALAAPILALGLHPSVLLLVALASVAGCGTEIFSIGWQTAYHQHIPNELLSRVASYDALGSFVAIPIGTLAFGPLAGVFGARDVLVVAAFLYVVIALGTLLSESVRNLPAGDLGARPLQPTESTADAETT
ncbi:MAG: MFS transporter [Actinomycetota bacterium]|nr:MFS transporter [Actinomycetota bacterium]